MTVLVNVDLFDGPNYCFNQHVAQFIFLLISIGMNHQNSAMNFIQR